MVFMDQVVVRRNRRSIGVREDIRGIENGVLVKTNIISPKRQPVVLSQGVIDFGHDLVEVLAIRLRIKHDAFRVAGLRQEAQQLFGGRVDRCACGRDVGRRWNCCGARISDITETSPLIAGEEKSVIFDDWATDGAAKLIPLERVALRSKEISRIQNRVAIELEDIAVYFVRS